MARVLGAEWPLEQESARMVVDCWPPLVPLLIDSEAAKGVDATYELTVDGGPRMLAWFREGAVRIEPPESRPPDCRLSGDPVAWLLAFYGRAGWEDLLRTGRVQVTGGDADLGAGFKRLVRK
ncbi:MAG: SCP2 sterol-binding domain-containing protein [Pseudonocardia sp.]